MSTTSNVVITSAIVVTGKWAKGEELNPRIIGGAAVLALILAGIDASSPDLASKFALAVLLLAAFTYLPAITKKFGWTK